MKKSFIAILLFVISVAALATSSIASPSVLAAGNDSMVAGEPCELATSCLELAQRKNAPIVLQQGVTLESPLEISATTPITIDLNGNTLDGKDRITMVVRKGNVTLTGRAGSAITYSGLSKAGGTVYVKGSDNPSDQNYTTLNIGSDVTIRGFIPLTIDLFGGSGPGKNNCYGVAVNIAGHLLNDESVGPQLTALQIKSYTTNTDNAPRINIESGATLESTVSQGIGIVSLGYANIVVGEATISGATGILAKKGAFEFNGTNIVATGAKQDQIPGKPTALSGAAIQLESSATGNLSLEINGGNYSSANNSVLLEYGKNTDQTSVDHIKITGGEFKAAANQPALNISESFAAENPGFISGGTYLSGDEKSNVAEYMQPGLEQNPDGTVIDPAAAIPEDETSNDIIISATANQRLEAIENPENPENPDTADRIALYVTIAAFALLGLGATMLIAKKVNR